MRIPRIASLRRWTEATGPVRSHLPIDQPSDVAPTVMGNVDWPQPGVPAQRSLQDFRGWHAWQGGPVLAVVATVAGIEVGRALGAGDVRQDLIDVLGEGFARCGWTMPVDLSTVTETSVVVDFTVWPSVIDGPILAGSVPVRIAPTTGAVEVGEPRNGPVVGHFDGPSAAGPLQRDVVVVSGWALSPRGPLAQVAVVVDDDPPITARIGLLRQDLRELMAEPYAQFSGFEVQLDLTQLDPESTSIRLACVVTDFEGVRVVVDTQVVELASPPVPAEPARHSKPARNDTLSAVQAAMRRWSGGGSIALGTEAQDGLNLMVFTHHLGLGGGQLWLSELLLKCGAGSEFRCTVVSAVDGELRGALEEAGIGVHVTGPYPTETAVYEGRIRELSAMAAVIGANAVLVNTMGSFLGADLAGRLGLPAVWAVHESFTPAAFWAAAYPAGYVDVEVKAAASAALRATAAIVFEADSTRQLFLDAATEQNCLVVPYGIDTESVEKYCADVSVAEARSMLGIPSEARLVVVLGTVEPRKAQALVAEAMSHLGGKFPDLMVALVGDTGGPYGDAIADFVSTSEAAAQVLIFPVTPDTYPWYRAADVFLSASDIESLPRSVLEAMCFGVPVVATSVFGLPELIDDGQTGYLYEARDLRATVEALEQIATRSAGELERVGAAGRRKILKSYDSRWYAHDIRSILEGLALEPSAPPRRFLRAR